MKIVEKLKIYSRIACELGINNISLYALYRAGLKSGHFKRRLSSIKPDSKITFPNTRVFSIPERDRLLLAIGNTGFQSLIEEAEEIVAGKVRLFGGDAVSLNLQPALPLKHALAYKDTVNGDDIKFTWEPARFGWAVVLARAFYLTNDEKYIGAFWAYFKIFHETNPTFNGPNWSSGQEVALRLVGLVFASQIFAASSASNDLNLLASDINLSAKRIETTFIYARAQNNNHLLTEALGLFVAGIFASNQRWQQAGYYWLNRGFKDQISNDGEYIQHSTCYHRLMLQTALWMMWLCESNNIPVPEQTQAKIRAALTWLTNHLDYESGCVSNLGHNDGAFILPLAVGGACDYRAVLQASSYQLRGETMFPQGEWDEMKCWLGVSNEHYSHTNEEKRSWTRLENRDSWASLRSYHYKNRPAHADQLHVDLWWRGKTILLDAGTYAYNKPTPWDNGLRIAQVHNSLTVDHQGPMTIAGRFLWTDWDQSHLVLEKSAAGKKICAVRYGYKKTGVIHERTLEKIDGDHWRITDHLLPVKNMSHEHDYNIQFLLPDWDWVMDEDGLQIYQGELLISLKVESGNAKINGVDLVRAGKSLTSSRDDFPLRGWYSPTYGVRLPALSYRCSLVGTLPTVVVTTIGLGCR